MQGSLPTPTVHSCFFRMFRRGDYTGEVRRRLRAELSSLGEGVRACAEEITRNGLPARAIAPLLRVARGPSPSLPQLKPLVSYNAAFRAKPDRHCEHPLQLCTHHRDSPEHFAHTQKRQEFSHSAQAELHCLSRAECTESWPTLVGGKVLFLHGSKCSCCFLQAAGKQQGIYGRDDVYFVVSGHLVPESIDDLPVSGVFYRRAPRF